MKITMDMDGSTVEIETNTFYVKYLKVIGEGNSKRMARLQVHRIVELVEVGVRQIEHRRQSYNVGIS